MNQPRHLLPRFNPRSAPSVEKQRFFRPSRISAQDTTCCPSSVPRAVTLKPESERLSRPPQLAASSSLKEIGLSSEDSPDVRLELLCRVRHLSNAQGLP